MMVGWPNGRGNGVDFLAAIFVKRTSKEKGSQTYKEKEMKRKTGRDLKKFMERVCLLEKGVGCQRGTPGTQHDREGRPPGGDGETHALRSKCSGRGGPAMFPLLEKVSKFGKSLADFER